MTEARIVYFDRNVFDSIRRKFFITDSHYVALLDAIKSKTILVPLSVPLIEETLPVMKTRSAFKIRIEQQIISELPNWHFVIKPHYDLVYDDIRSYASNTPFLNPFIPFNLTSEEMFTPSPELEQVIEETHRRKVEGLRDLKSARRIIRSRIEPDSLPPFNIFWNDHALSIIRMVAENLGVLSQCEARGMSELLKIRSVKMYTAWYLSYAYTKLFGRGRLKGSDYWDHQHCVYASVAQTFVTEDRPLVKLLKQVPMLEIEVIGLETLLTRLVSPDMWEFYAQHSYKP